MGPPSAAPLPADWRYVTGDLRATCEGREEVALSKATYLWRRGEQNRWHG